MEHVCQHFWIQVSSTVVGQEILASPCLMVEFLIASLRHMFQKRKLKKRLIDRFQEQHNAFVSEGIQLIV